MLNKFDYTVSAGYEFAEENSNLEEKRLVNNINKNKNNGYNKSIIFYIES